MKVTTLVLNKIGEPHFRSEDQFNIEELFEIAKPREQIFRSRGAELTAGAVTYFGSEVIKAVDSGEHNDVTKAIIQLLMATWLFDSLYSGVTAALYLKSDMEFTIAADNTVVHTRVPNGS